MFDQEVQRCRVSTRIDRVTVGKLTHHTEHRDIYAPLLGTLPTVKKKVRP